MIAHNETNVGRLFATYLEAVLGNWLKFNPHARHMVANGVANTIWKITANKLVF